MSYLATRQCKACGATNRIPARHLANAVVKETPDGAYITKDGRNSPRKIDLAVAAVVAYDRAVSGDSGGGAASYDFDELERLAAERGLFD